MRGQWIGKYSGSTEGTLILNIDETIDNFDGVAYVRPTDKNFPAAAAHFQTDDKSLNQKVVAYVYPIDPRNGFQCAWNDIKDLYEADIAHSVKADISIELLEGTLRIAAMTDIGVEISSEIKAPRETDNSLITGNVMSWSDFKSHLTQRSKSKFLFRGQQEPWRLRTAFHRRGRYRMSRFTGQDVKQLHRRLSAITTHYFDLSVAEENGAFLI